MVPSARLVCIIATVALGAAEDTGPLAACDIQAHGFASFGHLRSWGNDWLGNSSDGTNEFWEAAINAVARPADRLRLGAQIFARDLGRYDNGKPTLDWAYADYRHDDWLGVQAGRFKLPIGLYNEVLDVDAARTPVLLPTSVYALRSRDLYISTDGLKLYGLVELGAGGSLEYQAYAGRKGFDESMGFATYFSEFGLGERIERIVARHAAGGMLHWNTPCEGLGLRLSGANIQGFEIDGSTPALGLRTHTEADDYLLGVASIVYECTTVTVAVEHSWIRGRGSTRIEPFGISRKLEDDRQGGYASATWHWRPWLEWYAAGEWNLADPDAPQRSYLYTAVVAANFMPRDNWSLKAELRDNFGTMNVSTADEPRGPESRWQVLALKTTVDF